MAESALDRLMDLANIYNTTITWGRKGALHTVTFNCTCFCRKCGRGGKPYHYSGIAETCEGAAKALLNFAFNE